MGVAGIKWSPSPSIMYSLFTNLNEVILMNVQFLVWQKSWFYYGPGRHRLQNKTKGFVNTSTFLCFTFFVKRRLPLLPIDEGCCYVRYKNETPSQQSTVHMRNLNIMSCTHTCRYTFFDETKIGATKKF